MSKPRYRWWTYVCNVIKAYPKLRAASCLTEDDQMELKAVNRAIEIARDHKYGDQMMELIRRIYWDRTDKRIADAAKRMYISERTANDRHGEFIRLVGSALGFHPKTKKGGQGAGTAPATCGINEENPNQLGI